MKHIVSVSGGVGSYFTLKRVIEKHGRENVIGIFCDTLAEDGDLYRFLEDIEDRRSADNGRTVRHRRVRMLYGK